MFKNTLINIKPYSYKIKKSILGSNFSTSDIYFEDDELILTINNLPENIVDSIVKALNGAYIMGTQHNERYNLPEQKE